MLESDFIRNGENERGIRLVIFDALDAAFAATEVNAVVFSELKQINTRHLIKSNNILLILILCSIFNNIKSSSKF